MVTAEVRKYYNITAFRHAGRPPIAFHAERLESAQISDEIWQEMKSSSEGRADTSLNSLQDLLKSWSEESAPKVFKVQEHRIDSLSINVTQVCNLHCVYCAAGGDGTYGDAIKRISVEKTLPQIKFFLEKASENSIFRITYIGGEPLLYPEALRIIHDYAAELCAAKNIELKEVVVTNGTLFNDKAIEVLGHLKASITVSLDGAADVNDQLRPSASGRGVTSQVVSGLKTLLQGRLEGLPVKGIGVSGVFGRRNPNLLRAYEFYQSLGVDWFDFTYDHLETEASVNESYVDEMQKVMALAFANDGESGLRKIKLIDNYFSMLDEQRPVRNYCGAGKSYLVIDARNDLYSCPWLSGKTSEKMGQGTQLNEASRQKLAEDLVDLHGCQSCWARGLCGGGCMFIHENKTGNKHKVDENFCFRTQTLIAETLLYYEQCRSTAKENSQ